MKVIHCVPSLYLTNGGPSRSVTRLCDELAENNSISISLLFRSDSIKKTILCRSPLVANVPLLPRSSFHDLLGFVLKEFKTNDFDSISGSILHVHGVWHLFNHHLISYFSKRNIPYVVQPRGMLEPWSLSHQAPKKRLALALYQRSDLLRAGGFVATSLQEATSIRLLNLMQPIAVIPNGIDHSVSDVSYSHVPHEGRVKTALFLSRIHPKKGLLELLIVWNKLRPVGWELIIAGPDDGGYLSTILEFIANNRLENCVRYVGEVYGPAKSNLYQLADLFVLPTYSENFGLVVAEALASGTPVLTTKGTPWSELVEFNCGWWIDCGERALEGALRDITKLSVSQLREKGLRGVRLSQKYSWSDVANKTKEFYDYILGNAKKPPFVV